MLFGAVSSAIINHLTPNTPTIGTATNVGTNRAYNNGLATVAFIPSGTGSPATSFQAISSPGGFTGSGSSSPITITGLQSGVNYTFTVIAINSAGSSSASSASNSITATTVPQAPTIGTVTLSGANAISTPVTDGATGGSAIISRTVTSSSGGYSGSGTSPITVSSIGSGTFTFSATCTNANGTSASSSASNSKIFKVWGTQSLPSAFTAYTVTRCGSNYLMSSGFSSGGLSSSTIYTSSTGVTWTARSMPASATWCDFATSGSRIVAVSRGSGANQNATSDDGGLTWTGRIAPSGGLLRVSYGAGLFVALINSSSSSLYTSSDGITWTVQNTGATTFWLGIGWSGSRFIITDSTTLCFYSSNGTSWTRSATDFLSSKSWEDVIWIGGTTWLAAGGAVACEIHRSTDNGDHWANVASVGGGTISPWLCTNGSMIIATLGTAGIYISQDSGSSWVSSTSSAGGQMFKGASDGTSFVLPIAGSGTVVPTYS